MSEIAWMGQTETDQLENGRGNVNVTVIRTGPWRGRPGSHGRGAPPLSPLAAAPDQPVAPMTQLAELATGRRLQFAVPGVPQPQGSKDAHHRNGKTWVTEANKQLRPWRDAVTWHARQALDGRFFNRIEGPVRMTVTFTFPRPKGHYGTGRNAGRLKDSAPRWVTSQQCGDLDKLVRGVGDALTAAGVWGDDSQVVSVFAVKGYGERPGAFIEVQEVT